MSAEPTIDELIDDTLFLMAIHDKTEEKGQHLVWTGLVDSSDAPVIRRGGRRLLSVRRLLLQLNGQDMTGLLATSRCNCPLCINHVRSIDRKSLQIRSAKTTNWAKSPARCASIAAKRRKTAILTVEVVRQMREAANDGMTTREAAKVYGVSQGTAADAIAGRTWKDYSNPWMGLMA